MHVDGQGPAAVVFDCDGLLLDTEDCWTRAETELFARHGRVFTPAHKRLLLGKAGDPAAAILADALGQPGRGQALTVELLELALTEVARGAAPRPGAAELVEELRGGVPLGLASNSPRAMVDLALEGGWAGRGLRGGAGRRRGGQPQAGPGHIRRGLRAARRQPRSGGRARGLADRSGGRHGGRHVRIAVPSLPGLLLRAPHRLVAQPAESVRPALGLPAHPRGPR